MTRRTKKVSKYLESMKYFCKHSSLHFKFIRLSWYWIHPICIRRRPQINYPESNSLQIMSSIPFLLGCNIYPNYTCPIPIIFLKLEKVCLIPIITKVIILLLSLFWLLQGQDEEHYCGRLNLTWCLQLQIGSYIILYLFSY